MSIQVLANFVREANKAQKKRSTTRYEKDEERANANMDVILEHAKAIGITEMNSNNYWFNFTYKDFYLSFVNQTGRICGNIHLKPKTDDERIVFSKYEHDYYTYEDNRMCSPEEMGNYLEFKNYFFFEHFVNNGDPVHKAKIMLNKLVIKGDQ